MVKDFSKEKKELIENTIRDRGITDEDIISAFYNVPRENFIPSSYKSYSYIDSPVPIGKGQTISQPYIIAFMLDLLKLESSDKVLEFGSGSGYVLALLAEIVDEVVGVELEETLVENSRQSLKLAGLKEEINVICGDGSDPDIVEETGTGFDKILASAAVDKIPEFWKGLLVEGGKLVMPLEENYVQTLLKYVKKEGELVEEGRYSGVRFVPLRSKGEKD